MNTCVLGFFTILFCLIGLVLNVSGIMLIALGGYIIHQVSDYIGLLDINVLGFPIVGIVVGIIIFIIAFLGCCGAITENYKMLIAFGVVLLIVFIVELSVGIVAAVEHKNISDAFKIGLKDSMKKYRTDEDIKKMWDQFQTQLQCCGVDSSNDWLSTPPDSCKSNGNSVYNYKGCYDHLQMLVQDFVIFFMYIGIGNMFVEVIEVIIAFSLAYAIRKGEK